MRPDGLPITQAELGHVPTRTSYSCCLGMCVTAFRTSAAGLVESPMERKLAEVIAGNLRMTMGFSPSASERKSWENSLPVLAKDLVEAGLGDVEMLIEYQLPLTSKRADVVLAGVDRRTGGDAYVVVELKQRP